MVDIDGPLLEVEPEAGGARATTASTERRANLVTKRPPTIPDLHEFALYFTEFAKVHRCQARERGCTVGLRTRG